MQAFRRLHSNEAGRAFYANCLPTTLKKTSPLTEQYVSDENATHEADEASLHAGNSASSAPCSGVSL